MIIKFSESNLKRKYSFFAITLSMTLFFGGFINSFAEEKKNFSDGDILAYIPERNWNPDIPRRDLTKEVAIQYPARNFVPRRVVNNAWGVGEHLEFSVDYGFYSAGTATMSVKGIEQVNGAKCYHIKTTARSNSFISRFFKVRDVVNSFVDVNGLFSWRFEKEISEGKYRSNSYVDFYHNRLIALNTSNKHAISEIPMYVQDVLSIFYYLRTLDLEVGKSQFIDVYADGKVYPMEVIVHGRETVSVPAGRFNTLKVEPVMQSDGIFKQRGKLLVWLTEDEKKIPVRMTSEIAIGRIATNLVSMRTANPNEEK